jgi:DNA-directed RNA polymerase sigma subunit (sigma70/sigma32)
MGYPDQEGSEPRPSGGSDLRDLAAQAAAEPKLRRVEERHLLERAALGDGAARDRLFRAHAGLVIRLAEAQLNRGLELAELLQEGSLGLMAAISDPRPPDGSLAGRVEATVSLQLEQALEREAEAERAARQLVEDAEAYERAEIAIRRRLGRAPTEPELAQQLEWSVTRTRRLAEMIALARRQHDEELLIYLNPEELVERGGAEDDGAEDRRGSL